MLSYAAAMESKSPLQVYEGIRYHLICKQDACTGVHSACRREENGHNLDICVLRRLRLRQGQMQGFLGLKVEGGGGVS